MTLNRKLLDTLPDGEVEQVIIGLHWTAVSVFVNKKRYCGLSSTVSKEHAHGKDFDVPEAGKLTELSGLELADYVNSDNPTLSSLGVAAINALNQTKLYHFTDINAEHVITEKGEGKNITLVGHFPFVERLKSKAKRLDILENRPQEGDLPAGQADLVIPDSDVVAITGMTMVNHTLENLLKLCKTNATVIILGSSTPLSPVLFDYGVDYLCGGIPAQIDSVMKAVAQGGCFPQIAKAGVRLVSMARQDYLD